MKCKSRIFPVVSFQCKYCNSMMRTRERRHPVISRGGKKIKKFFVKKQPYDEGSSSVKEKRYTFSYRVERGRRDVEIYLYSYVKKKYGARGAVATKASRYRRFRVFFIFFSRTLISIINILVGVVYTM